MSDAKMSEAEAIGLQTVKVVPKEKKQEERK